MVLATRCPHCETVFRLQETQLAASGGFARCGHCHQVFDASQNLLDPHAGGRHTAPEPRPASAPAPEAAAPEAIEHERAHDEAQEPTLGAEAGHTETPEPTPGTETQHAETREPTFGAEAEHAEAEHAEAEHAEAEHAEAEHAEAEHAEAEHAEAERAEAEHAEAEHAEAERAEAEAEVGPEAAQTLPELSEPIFEPEPPTRAGETPHTAPSTESVLEPEQTPEHKDVAPDSHAAPEPAPEPTPPAVDPDQDEPHSPHLAGQAAAPAFDAPEAEPQEAEPEPAEPPHVEGTERGAEPILAPSHEPHWHDDEEPGFNGRVPLDGNVEPHFGAQQPQQVQAEREFAQHLGEREADEDEAKHEPHLEPSLHAQAHVEPEPDVEPHFGAAAAEPRGHAAGLPPIFAEPPASGEHERHFTVTREMRATPPSRIFWRSVGGLIVLALIAALAAQLAWWRREAVMVYWPESQPLFARVCAQLGCQLSPPRDIDGLQVEASDLRQIDGPHRLELRVPLRNRYGIALAYPAIELTLFDSKNEVAIRRVLWPQDYVTPGTPVAAGLPAHATQTMIVRLDSGSAVATNFRVQIFYP